VCRLTLSFPAGGSGSQRLKEQRVAQDPQLRDELCKPSSLPVVPEGSTLHTKLQEFATVFAKPHFSRIFYFWGENRLSVSRAQERVLGFEGM